MIADSKVIANIDFVEVLALQLVLRRRRSSPVDFVFICRDSAKQECLMAFAAPNVRENSKTFLVFCSLIRNFGPILEENEDIWHRNELCGAQ